MKPDLEQARRFAEAIHARFRANCWPITARRRLTGRKILMIKPSPASSSSCRTWDTNTSLLPSRGSTACGSTCSTSPMPTLRVRGCATMLRKCSSRIRRRAGRLHLRLASAGGGHRLLRQGHHHYPGWHLVGNGADRLDRRRAVLSHARWRDADRACKRTQAG